MMHRYQTITTALRRGRDIIGTRDPWHPRGDEMGLRQVPTER